MEFIRTKKHHDKAKYLQDHDFKKICLELIDLIKTYGLEESKELKLMLYGFITHHILDSFAHPYIIHETEGQRLHLAVESYIDSWMIEQRENANPRKYKIHKIIPGLPKLDKSTVQVINEAFNNVYQFKNFGDDYVRALNQVNPFLYCFRYDKTGIKKLGYHLIDNVSLKKLNYFWLSYNNKFEGYSKYLNEEHRLWVNPVDRNITSTESFFELYKKAMVVSAKILSSIEEKIRDGSSINEFEEIIPDVSAVHGQKCNQNLELKYIKK